MLRLAVALGDVGELGDDAAAGLGLREGEVDGLLFRRNLDALDLFELLDAALHLLGFGGRVAEAVDEDFQLLDAVALVFVGRLHLLVALRLLRAGTCRSCRYRTAALVPDFDDLLDCDVEEVAVVRDQHVRVADNREIFFQPVAGFEVEMVGGLVEQQQVRLLQQKLGQRDAHLPAAGKFLGLASPVVFAEAQPGQDLADLHFEA